MIDIIEIKDFIPVDYQRHIETVMTGFEFPWVFNKNMVSGDDTFLDNVDNHAGFNHFFFEHQKTQSNFFQLFYPLVLSINSKVDIPFNMLIRMRANMTLASPESKLDWHMPHIDSFMPHYNAIYYVNDSDGDTVIFNETNEDFDPGQEDIKTIKQNIFTVKHRVIPEKGKLVVFNGKYYHSSSPVRNHKYRCVINMNLRKVL